MSRLLCILLFALCAKPASGKDLGRSANAQKDRGQLSFLENTGQVTDQLNNSRPDIQMLVATTQGLTIFIGSGEVHYQFGRREKPLTKVKKDGAGFLRHEFEEATYDAYRMDVALVGADKNAQLVKEERQDYYENHADKATGKHSKAFAFNRITYKNVYPDIDWVIYTSNGRIKQEFVVREGGDMADIQLRYSGATALAISADNSLAAATPFGSITEQAPVSYEADGTPVDCRFVLHGDLLTFDVGKHSGPLVIDPTLVWATYYGGYSAQPERCVATDKSDNVYIAGTTTNLSGIATSGAYQSTLAGANDAYLVKFNSAGARLWSTYFGGSGSEFGYAVATDDSNNVYLGGATTSTTGIATPGAYQGTYGGTGDAYLAKFDSTGAIKWATYYGGNDEELLNCIATDSSGNVYITGSTSSTTGIATPGAYQTSFGGGPASQPGDAFIAKFNSAGAIQWATYFGGGNEDLSYGLTTVGNSAIYIGGETASPSGIATPGAFMTALGGMNDGFVAKFSSAGAIIWSSYFGGGGSRIYSVASDTSGSVFITGATFSTSGIATPGAYQGAFAGGGYDGFLTKFGSAGAIQWSTYYGGSARDEGWAVTTDVRGNAYIAGFSHSASGIATPGSYKDTLDGMMDACLAIFDDTGAIQWATYYGGPGLEQATGLAMDHSGNVYVTGFSASASGIATPGAFQDTLTDASDAFLAKFHICSILPNPGSITGVSVVCKNSSITLADTTAHGTWSASNGNASIAGGSVTGMAAGVDTIGYSVNNFCATSTALFTVTVNALPHPVINVACGCVPGVYSGYQWYGAPHTLIPGATSSSYSMGVGSWYVVVDSGGCAGTSDTVLMTEGVGHVMAADLNVLVYPNPVQNELTVIGSAPITRVCISNLLGQVVFDRRYNAYQVQVAIADLPSGIYLARMNETEVRKFVKQ